MTATAIPTMVVEDADTCARPSILPFNAEPMECDHLWESHPSTGRAQCPRCGSVSRWSNDPRVEEASCGRRGDRAANKRGPTPREDQAENGVTRQCEVPT